MTVVDFQGGAPAAEAGIEDRARLGRSSRRVDSAGGPVRTCAGCQAKAAQSTLLRVGLTDGRPTPDPRRRLPGRGAYVHRSTACIERATRRGGLARAFRTQLPSPAVSDPMAWLVEAGPASLAGAELWDRHDERS
jgi:predicted RNA-binding protein YlxR (DUF448 family)